MSATPLELVQQSYRIMLQLPYTSPLRLANQKHMSQLRDYIAAQTGVPAQTVQENFEKEWVQMHINGR